MKKKSVVLLIAVLSLLLTAVLNGCGKAPAKEPQAELTPEPVQTEVLPEPTQAETAAPQPQLSAEEKALSAYQQILKAAPAIEGDHAELYDLSLGYEENLALFGNHYEQFALYDINQDGIPELIALSVVNFRWTPVSVFTCANGQAVLLEDPFDPYAHCTFEQNSTANGAYNTYICEENHIHSVWSGTNPWDEAVEDNYAYILVGTSLTAVDCPVGESGSTVYFYDIAKSNTAENADAIMQ